MLTLYRILSVFFRCQSSCSIQLQSCLCHDVILSCLSMKWHFTIQFAFQIWYDVWKQYKLCYLDSILLWIHWPGQHATQHVRCASAVVVQQLNNYVATRLHHWSPFASRTDWLPSATELFQLPLLVCKTVCLNTSSVILFLAVFQFHLKTQTHLFYILYSII